MSLLSSIRALWGGAKAPVPQPSPAFSDDRPSIFGVLKARREAAGDTLPLPSAELPDQPFYDADMENGMRWAPGALDGVFSHHVAQGGANEQVAPILAALKAACARPAGETPLALYEAVPKKHVLGAIDPLIGELAASGIDPNALHRVARWLATESPDREPVKLGIALLGALDGDGDTELFLTLGGHDEFTLFAAVALKNRLDPDRADRALWALARMTEGWGRIQSIERMSDEPPPEVASWLLRDGYANGVMPEYTARDCAAKGGLLRALRSPAPDGALLTGAGEILATLTNDQPGPSMIDYDDGAEAAALWVEKQGDAPPDDLRRLAPLRTLRDFAGDEVRGWSELEKLGWTSAMRNALAEAAAGSIRDPRWEALTRRGLDADDPVAFGRAAEAAPDFGIDVWRHHFARQRDGRGEQWWHLMRTDDRGRIEQVVALFRERIDVAALASGPALELGMGPDFADAMALDFVVPGLERFPGVGTPLVLAALKSPVIRNRNIALRTLAAWPRKAWPAEVEPALTEALAAEPDPQVHARMKALRDGRPLPD